MRRTNFPEMNNQPSMTQSESKSFLQWLAKMLGFRVICQQMNTDGGKNGEDRDFIFAQFNDKPS